MQGNLNEIDIRSILQLVELGQRTGELFVEAWPMGQTESRLKGKPHFSSGGTLPEQSWFVFFSNGQIMYAADSNPSLSRLQDYLRRYNLETALDTTEIDSIASTNALEYGHLWTLLENKVLTPGQGRSIIQSMVRETLFELLSLHQGSFIFEVGPSLSPQLTLLQIGPLIAKIMKQVQEWKQFHPHIQSPNQCPIITNVEELKKVLPRDTFKNLERWADGKTNLRQISRYLNRDILTVARAFYPFVQLGLVQLFYPESKHNEQIEPEEKKVVCIDDDLAIGKAVEHILGQNGYEVTVISNPLKALSLVFKLKPDLILCDITMPELDGYEICAMLRQSTAFRQIPLIMLTGLDGFINRVKARMIGANDYLTKPFGESELLMLVEKYIGLAKPIGEESIEENMDDLESLLAEVLETEIDPEIDL